MGWFVDYVVGWSNNWFSGRLGIDSWLNDFLVYTEWLTH